MSSTLKIGFQKRYNAYIIPIFLERGSLIKVSLASFCPKESRYLDSFVWR